MRLFIGIIVGFISATTALYAGDLILRNGRTIYTGNVLEQKPTITENDVAPANPQTGDIFRDITDNTVYIYNGTAWIVKRTTQSIKDDIATFKANISGVNDPEAKQCLKSLAKILLEIYKESAE